MSTEEKIVIGLVIGYWLLTRQPSTTEVTPANGSALRLVARDGNIVQPQIAGSTWRNDAPLTPTFAGGQSGYGTSALNSLVTNIVGLFTRPDRQGPSASAPNAALVPASPYAPGTAFSYTDAGVPGTWIDPRQTTGNSITLADPSLLLVPIPGYDGLIWAPDPGVPGA
jgi:hypothetical protein